MSLSLVLSSGKFFGMVQNTEYVRTHQTLLDLLSSTNSEMVNRTKDVRMKNIKLLIVPRMIAVNIINILI